MPSLLDVETKTSNAVLLAEEVMTLPSYRIAEVWDFVEFLKSKETAKAERGRNDDDSWFEEGGECPICVKYRDPVTGEPRYNAETIAAFAESDAILQGKIPARHYSIDDLGKMLGL